jgi:hypothetical protein
MKIFDQKMEIFCRNIPGFAIQVAGTQDASRLVRLTMADAIAGMTCDAN